MFNWLSRSKKQPQPIFVPADIVVKDFVATALPDAGGKIRARIDPSYQPAASGHQDIYVFATANAHIRPSATGIAVTPTLAIREEEGVTLACVSVNDMRSSPHDRKPGEEIGISNIEEIKPHAETEILAALRPAFGDNEIILQWGSVEPVLNPSQKPVGERATLILSVTAPMQEIANNIMAKGLGPRRNGIIRPNTR